MGDAVFNRVRFGDYKSPIPMKKAGSEKDRLFCRVWRISIRQSNRRFKTALSYSLYASIKISRIFFPAAATLDPGPKIATAPES